MYPFQFPSQTEKGIRHVSNAMVVFLVLGIVDVAVVSFLEPILPAAPTNMTAIATAIAIVGATCGVFVAEIVGAVLALLGVLALHRGRSEFGPGHERLVDRGILVLVLGVILPVAASNLLWAVGTSVGAVPRATPNLDPWIIATTSGLGVMASLFAGLFLLWTIEGLATPEGRKRGIIALALGVASGIVGGVSGAVVAATTPVPTGPGNFAYAFLLPNFLATAISVVSILLWYGTYRGVLGRFRGGELRPTPPVPAYPLPFAPGYVPLYVPAVPPPEPPARPQSAS